MSTKDDGGPAFPAQHFDMVDGEHGITLRDYFAAKAMLGQLTYGKCRDMTPKGIADYSYEFADAMLKARTE